jgi:hypothetical protein
MKKQYKQLVTLALLCIAWAISAHYNKLPPPPPSVIKTKAAKSAGDTVLMARFHRIRAKMDALYHYRIKPEPFDPSGDPFRVMAVKNVASNSSGSKDLGLMSAGGAERLLNLAIGEVRIGGVVTMDGVTQLIVDGRLHREGDVFAAKVLDRLVLIKIRSLSTYAVTLALEGSSAGKAEVKVRLR